MPRGKKLSKKIHDKKKSNPKRNIRKSKKGGVFKTEMVVVDTLITDMKKFIKEMEEFIKKNDPNDPNDPCNDSSLRTLISRINSVVGSTFGMRFMGVESCSNMYYTNTNTESYFKCEEKKIKQYEQIYDLCKIIYGILEENCQVSLSAGKNIYSTNLGKPIEWDNYHAFKLLSKDAEKLMDKHQKKLDTNQAYQEYKEDLKNKKIIKLEEDLPTYSETNGKDLYDTYKNEDTKATVSDVDYFYIEDNELVQLGKILGHYIYYPTTGLSMGEGSTGNVTYQYYIKFKNHDILAYTDFNGEIRNKNNFYSKKTPEMNEEVTAASVENAAETNQPGGKRRSRKKRNMKKSKKGKSKNRR